MKGHGHRFARLAGSALLASLIAAGTAFAITTPSKTPRASADGPPVALRSCAYAHAYPDWFQPVAAYYGCNPKITPRFDFASLYSAAAFRQQPVAAARRQATLAHDIALARAATLKYVSNLALARSNGYRIITRMIPNMGYHFMDPKVTGFDVRRPPILVYERSGPRYQLGALEWVWTAKPARPPLPGATYGSFGAGCHYSDGTFVPAATQAACPKTAPGSGASFGFWHPLLITMHVWLWYPNPSGLFASTNPLVAPFNAG